MNEEYLKLLRKKFRQKKMRKIISEYQQIQLFNTYANIIDITYMGYNKWDEIKKTMLFIAFKEEFHVEDIAIIYKYKKPRSTKQLELYKYYLLRMIIYTRDIANY